MRVSRRKRNPTIDPSALAAWATFGLGAGMTYAVWHSMMGGEETVIWGVIIMIAGALGVFAIFLLA
jgi:hypothetical protein